ncbi:hypothetical protein SBC1_28530 [Caballeronia sp. SBC1]|nr:hypothetical protein SBC1_28530 [Caballeronia sp. SBC1]
MRVIEPQCRLGWSAMSGKPASAQEHAASEMPRSWARRRLIQVLPVLAAASTGAAQPAYASSPARNAVLMDKAFGVKGDGRSNDRSSLQAAIDQSLGQTLMITGDCRIDAVGLALRSGSRVRFAPGASIKLLPHNASFYQIMRIWDVRDVILEGATLDGSRELNAAPNDPHNGGYGMGISIAGSSNITLISPTTTGCWGDGIYIANSYSSKSTWPSDIRVLDHRASRCRRQGVSIISGANIVFERPVWESIGGTLPSAGLDIEPNNNLDILHDIRIESPTTRNCRTGILMYLQMLAGPKPQYVQIKITDHRDEASAFAPLDISGLELKGAVVKGRIVIDSSKWVSPRLSTLRSEDYDRVHGPQIIVSNQRIIP